MKNRIKYFICKKKNTISGGRKIQECFIYIKNYLIFFEKIDSPATKCRLIFSCGMEG